MDNRKYLAYIGVTDEATLSRCLDAMAPYNDNKWWEPDVDPRKFAYYQLNEPILLGTSEHFFGSVELLLGRPVYTHEFSSIGIDNLKQEAERAWTYQIGCTSDAERKERVMESIEKLEKWAKEHGKKVIKFPLAGVEEK
jgi:hypothetical protein